MEEIAVDVEVAGGDTEEFGEAEGTGPMDGERKNKLEEVFSKDVVKRMAEYWTRIRNNDYTEAEIDFLLFEIVQYHTVVDQKLVDHRLRSLLPSWFYCCAKKKKGLVGEENSLTGKTDEDQSYKLDRKIEVPYVERKRMSEQARALFLQFTLELVSFVTDVAFLFLLYDFDQSLFVVSLTVLVVAMVARLVASIMVGHRIKIYPLYLLGLLVALVETNSGLRLIKLSLDRTPEGGIPFFWYGGELAGILEKDAVSGLAQTSRRIAWNEVIYIFCVTLLEDIPQLVIQALFVSQSEETLSLLSQVTIGSTILHIVFQWIEALISLRAIFGELPLIADGREMSYDQFGNLATRYDTLFDKGVRCLCKRRFREGKRVCLRVKEDMEKHGTYIRSLDLAEVSHYIDSTVYEQIASSCDNIQLFKAQGKNFTDECLRNLAEASPNLRELDVRESVLTGTSFRFVSGCKRLTSCIFAGCRVDDKSFQGLLTHLHPSFLPLCLTNVSNITLKSLMPKMNEAMGDFQFTNTNIDDDGLFALAQHPKSAVVAKLLLDGTQVGDRGVEAVCSTFLNLKELSLARTNVTNQSLVFVANCVRLIWLELSKIPIEDTSVKALAQSATKLQALYLDETRITFDSVDMILTNCSELKFLNISKNVHMHRGRLDRLTEGFKHELKTLDISNTRIAASHLQEVLHACPELTSLDLKNYELMTTETVKEISKCERLEELFCEGVQFSNHWLHSLTAGEISKCLHKFAFEGEDVDAAGFKNLNGLSTKFSALNIGPTREVTSKDVVNLLTRYKNLTELGLCRVNGVTNDTIKRVSRVCKKLKKLQLDHTGISSESLRFISRWPRLSALSLRGIYLQGSVGQLTCEHIVQLDLSSSGINNSDTELLCGSLRKVAFLQLDHCPIDDTALRRIGEVWMLTLLTIVGCSDVTNDGLLELCAKTPTISILYFGQTSISDEAVPAIVEFCPPLQKVGTMESDVSAEKIKELRSAQVEVEDKALYLASGRKTIMDLRFYS